MKNNSILISKSKYLAGMQCHKLLWYHYNNKSAFPETDAGTQAKFDQGHLVGNYAKTLFPDGIAIEWDIRLNEVIKLTQAKLKERKPLFEAGFEYQNGYARVDILNPAPHGKWDIIEVKSSANLKEENLSDVAFQKYVYQGAGIEINQCYLLLIDTSYTRHGAIDPHKLFKKVDVTKEVDDLLPKVNKNIDIMLEIINRAHHPEIKIGGQCSKPNPCPLQELCWKFLPERNIFSLNYGGKKITQLFNREILKIKDIPSDFPLSQKQQIQVEAEKSQNLHLEPEKLRHFLTHIKYPLYSLDFETYNPAIPLHDNSSPYEQVPFQYSLHILPEPSGKLEHYSYLAEGQTDPRPEIVAKLQEELGDYGSIIAYNATFEQGILKNCADRFPKYKKWVESIIPRFIDLMKPFKSFAYYHPDQNGSASLKLVMPALIGKGYEDMEISDGGQASQEFLRVTYTEVSQAERNQVRTALELYCQQDTEGMVEMLDALQTISE
jgi:hypothetical protein